MDTKEKRNAAFRDLRKAGFIAKQNFSCCGSCAGYEIAAQVKEMSEAKRARVQGTVFYTKQDAARMRDSGRGWSYRPGSNKLFLAYGPVSVHEVGEFGVPVTESGYLIKAALEKQGLQVEWDGDPVKKIGVVL